MNQLKILYLLIPLTILGCSDDEPQSVNATFSSESASGTESSGPVVVNLQLSAPASSDAQIDFSLSGDALLNGDFKLITASPITIAAGETTGSIQLEIIDDEIIEAFTIVNGEAQPLEEKQIIIELTSATGNVVIPETGNTFTYSFSDDDDIPESGLKTDLLWTVRSSGDIDDVNLDLLALYDVVIEDNTITGAEFYSVAGDNPSGFETLTITEDAPDSDYYLAIAYNGGSGTADFTFYSYLPSGIIYGEDEFAQPESEGALQVYGPITTKSGSDFSRLSKGRLNAMPKTNLQIDESILK